MQAAGSGPPFLLPVYWRVRRLIINADDFGLTAGVNQAIEEAFAVRAITSATLMANSAHFDQAAHLSRDGQLAVGCHVVLVDGEPVSPAKGLATLAVERGRFRQGFGEMAWAAMRGRLSADEIEREATAQMQALLDAGLRPTHFDTHKHTHMLPQVLRPLLRAAKRCGIPALRNPFAPVKPLALAHLARRPKLWTRYSEVKLLRGFADSFRRTVTDAGLKTTDGTFGVVVTGALDMELFQAIIGNLPEGTWEFVCHPGYCDEELRRVKTRLTDSRQCELEVLTSQRAREILGRAGVELISFRDL